MRRFRTNFSSSLRPRKKSAGLEKALEHIREAKALNREMGGIDEDVKEYFFSLPSSQLKLILDKYEEEYGASKRDYAEKTIPEWKNGEVHMSGDVATRLLKLLPPIMPIEKKFQLVESLWKHVGPSSSKTYYIGLDANIEDVSRCVESHLKEVVVNYDIPKEMDAKFDWLSHKDVAVKQQLLNHFRQQKKELLSEAIKIHLPVLLGHLNSEKGNLTTHASQMLKVGKHEVKIILTAGINGISEKAPARISKSGGYGWIWWGVGLLFVWWLLGK